MGYGKIRKLASLLLCAAMAFTMFGCAKDPEESSQYPVRTDFKAPDSYYEISFGEYKGGLHWLVLEEKDGKALVISKEIIYVMENTGTTWRDSSVREWLNEEFYDKAFEEKYKDIILTTDVVIVDKITENDKEKELPLYTTQDRVFLLDEYEFEMYFPRKSSVEAVNVPHTLFAEASAKEYEYSSLTDWWLRGSVDIMQNCYLFPLAEGDGTLCHTNKDYAKASGVRPAMWINYDKYKAMK